MQIKNCTFKSLHWCSKISKSILFWIESIFRHIYEYNNATYSAITRNQYLYKTQTIVWWWQRQGDKGWVEVGKEEGEMGRFVMVSNIKIKFFMKVITGEKMG